MFDLIGSLSKGTVQLYYFIQRECMFTFSLVDHCSFILQNKKPYYYT